jgi:hypothetical protein
MAMNWNGFGRTESRCILRYYPGIRVAELTEDTENPILDRQPACIRDQNRLAPECE